MKRLLVILGVLVFVGLLGGGFYYWRKNNSRNSVNNNSVSQNDSAESQTLEFDKTKYSLTDPASVWVVVNKKRGISTEYIPSDLVVPNVKLRLSASSEQMHINRAALADLEEMFAAAKKDGLELLFGSGYRSASYQRTLYNGYLTNDGQAAADKYSARPGHSEHQTGWAVDLDTTDQRCHLQECFADTEEGKWLAANAYKYGFILRYLKDKTEVTGYNYEPWHFRYVGKELALEMHGQNITTLEEFFTLESAANY